MNKFFTTCLALLLGTSLIAAPARRGKRTVVLADGTQTTVSVYGDENTVFYVSEDGRHLQPLDDGTFVFVTDKDVLRLKGQASVRRRVGCIETSPLPNKGDVEVPVVLVQFSDRKFMETDATALVNAYDQYFNGENYTAHGSTSSVRDYFLHESDGQFRPHFTVFSPVTLDNGYAYYGKDSGSTMDVNYKTFCTETLTKLVGANPSLDWKQFDNGGNGKVDLAFFIFAGTGQNSTYDANELWPKESTAATTVNGVTFETTALCNEAGQSGKLEGIGVMLHEFMHALGLPDFYDTTNGATPVYGMDLFSIMDYGEYNGNGYKPSGLTAYERDFLQWRPLVELTTAGHYQLQPVNATGGQGYKIVNDLNPNEYYVLEYRTAVGNDVALAKYASGMTVTHVDYNASAWTQNKVNTVAAHQRITLLPAAGDLFGIGWVTDATTQKKYLADLGYVPFPGKGEVVELTNESTPYAAVTYTGQYMSKPLYNITEDAEGQTVAFDYLEQIPVALAHAVSAPDSGDNVWYTMDGRRICGTPCRGGLYIKNGKKVSLK